MTHSNPKYTGCPCATCLGMDYKVNGHLYDSPFHHPAFMFIICPECGNKRCPKATYHIHKCTNSNESGQEGSRYK